MLTVRRPDWNLLRSDAIAGIPGAIGSVPDGMAASVLAGVNPIHGLYASVAGPIAGGATASTRLMLITTTSAAALAAGSAISAVPQADRPAALFLLTAIAGVLMVLAGFAKLGRYTRFVSQSVMLGFLTGVACNIIFSQIPDLAGVEATGPFALARAIDVLTHPSQIDWQSVAIGCAAIATMALLRRTRLSSVSALLALVLPTAAAAILQWNLVLVADVGAIPTGIPLPALPSFRLLSLDLILGAISVAAIVLVQGSGVAETAPNIDGTPSDPNRDFIAQGVGNIASGLLQGQPVGGSVGQTALNITAGAKGRWASIFSGIWMVAILVLFSSAVGKVAMTTLAGLLIYAAVGALRLPEVRTIMRTGPTSQIAFVTTLIATLVLPIAAAVGIGVALSLLLQLNQEAMDLKVVELEPVEGGRLLERPVSATLASRRVTLLDAYGSLLYAGAKTLQGRLPDPTGSEQAAVVLRMRGRTTLGSTFFAVLTDYAARIAVGGGRVYLSGVAPELHARMIHAGVIEAIPNLEIFESRPTVAESSLEAYDQATAWLAAQH